MQPHRVPPEDHSAADDLEAHFERQPPSIPRPAVTAVGGEAGLAERHLRDSLIDTLLRGEDPRPLGFQTERAILDERLVALGAHTRRAGDEIRDHMVHFVDTAERFALVVEQFKVLPQEISSVPELLTEICDRLARIAAIGRDLSTTGAQVGR